MKRLLFLTSFCIVALTAYSQSYSIVNPDSVSHNFYRNEIVQGKTITFKVDHSLNPLIRISNANNTKVGKRMVMKDGSKPAEPVEMSMLSPVSSQPIIDAFISTFTPEEIRALALNNEHLRVRYALSTNGNVLEVAFTILENHPQQYNMPPQYLEQLERKLKSVVFFVPNDYKQYQFITLSQDIYFKPLVDKL